MSTNLRAIRNRLKMTQLEIATAIGRTQANVSHYETARQEMPPSAARILIAVARSRGVELTFDEIYGQCSSQAAA